MNGIGTNRIETERLILRRMTADDAEDIYKAWTSDEQVTKYVSWDKHESLDVTKKYVAYKVGRYDNEFCFDWVIELKKNHRVIGEMEAVKVSLAHRKVEMGDVFGREYWNHGYATEALKAFIRYMFCEVGVEKVVACHYSLNPASGRVMQKAGMTYDAALKNYIVDKTTGGRCDLVYYSIDNQNLKKH